MQNLELTKERNIQNLELATGFAVSGWVLLANLEGISDEESVVQPKEAGNCVNWVAGHILMARGGLLKLLGEQPILSEEEAKPYQQGSPPLKPGDTRLPLDKLRVDLQKNRRNYQRQTPRTASGEVAGRTRRLRFSSDSGGKQNQNSGDTDYLTFVP